MEDGDHIENICLHGQLGGEDEDLSPPAGNLSGLLQMASEMFKELIFVTQGSSQP